MDGNNRNFDYFLIKFNDFDQINIGRVTFDLFYLIFDKIYQSVTCNSYNTSIIEPISTDSPPNDKWGFGYLIGWFVGGTCCTLQTLYAWLMRGFGIGMVGILIYRVLHLSLGCDSWYACYVIILVK